MQSPQSHLKSLGNPEQAKLLQGFFKTGKGQYGEGDIFLGIKVPDVRKVVKNYTHLDFKDIQILLDSKIHEERFSGLLILMAKYKKAQKEKNEGEKEKIFNFYLKNTKRVNNWDLVDVTCRDVIGAHLYDKPKDILYNLAKSLNMWERRIAIISTFHFIGKGQLDETIKLAETLINDTEDLMHKAVGWALREVGKRNQKLLESFLKKHYKTMPRTALRYSIEKFPEKTRKAYLHGNI